MQVKASNLFNNVLLSKSITLLLFFLFVPLIFAQENSDNNETKNSVREKNYMFVEAGGNGILLSINYERLIFDKIGLRTGIGTLALYGLTIPAMINYYFGSNRQLELGIGIVYTDYFPRESEFIHNGEYLIGTTVGYKFQKENSNIILRFSFTPFYSTSEDKVLPFGGISLGCAF